MYESDGGDGDESELPRQVRAREEELLLSSKLFPPAMQRDALLFRRLTRRLGGLGARVISLGRDEGEGRVAGSEGQWRRERGCTEVRASGHGGSRGT
jgi:hypothetical protein